MQPRGGTELLLDGLKRYINLDSYNVNLITSACFPQILDPNRPNVIWQHHSYDQRAVAMMANKSFTDAVDNFVYVSNWQYEAYRKKFYWSFNNGHVIKNAIEPIEYLPRSTDSKIRLIYTSTPFRGLDVLLDSFALLNRDDVELHIYSSTIIYGDAYDKSEAPKYKSLFDKASSTKGVTVMGYASNEDVRRAVQQAHIFAYPSTFEETSCLSLMRSQVVLRSWWTLFDTSLGYGTLVPMESNRQILVKRYAEALNNAIDTYPKTSLSLEEQSIRFNEYYSWEARAKEWKAFLEPYIKPNL